MTDDEIRAHKTVEFYAASVNAWYASALEHDKSVFALAAGGIAILVTLLTTVGVSTWATSVLFAGAIASFLTTLVALLTIFRKNQTYIEATLACGQPYNDPSLRRLDLVALVAFGVGVVFASAVGVSSAIDSFTAKRTDKEKAMATESTNQKTQIEALSVFGVGRLQPDAAKSFHGVGNLQPTASTPVAAPAASASTAAATAPAPVASTTAPVVSPSTSKPAP